MFNGKNFWTWVVATKDWAYYTIKERRSHKVAKEMESMGGVDTIDGYAGYNKLQCEQQRCWAHLLRRAKKPIYLFGVDEKYGDYKAFAGKLSLPFHDAKMEKKECGTSEKLRDKYDKKLWKLLQSAPTEGKNFTRLTNYIMKLNSE